ncbi:hypothetical protein B0T10DRAFT_374886, partial [Thelonectria olida]
LDPKDSYSRTPLLLSARKGHETVVKALLGKGADMESKDNFNDQTRLYWAATNG